MHVGRVATRKKIPCKTATCKGSSNRWRWDESAANPSQISLKQGKQQRIFEPGEAAKRSSRAPPPRTAGRFGRRHASHPQKEQGNLQRVTGTAERTNSDGVGSASAWPRRRYSLGARVPAHQSGPQGVLCRQGRGERRPVRRHPYRPDRQPAYRAPRLGLSAARHQQFGT